MRRSSHEDIDEVFPRRAERVVQIVREYQGERDSQLMAMASIAAEIESHPPNLRTDPKNQAANDERNCLAMLQRRPGGTLQ